jgi:hypothetical protein
MCNGQLVVSRGRTIVCRRQIDVPAELKTVSTTEFMKRLFDEEAVSFLFDTIISNARHTAVDLILLRNNRVYFSSHSMVIKEVFLGKLQMKKLIERIKKIAHLDDGQNGTRRTGQFIYLEPKKNVLFIIVTICVRNTTGTDDRREQIQLRFSDAAV